MAEADKYAPIVKSKNGRPVIMTVDDVELFHTANPEFWAAVQRMPKGYILSTRAERSDKPQVHLHRVPCTVWQRAPSYGPGQTPNHTTRYVKGVSNSILARLPVRGHKKLDSTALCTRIAISALGQAASPLDFLLKIPG